MHFLELFTLLWFCSVKLLTRLSYSGYSNKLYHNLDHKATLSSGSCLLTHNRSLFISFSPSLTLCYTLLLSLFHACGTCILQSCLSLFCLLSIPFPNALPLPFPPPSPVGKLIYRPSAIVNHSLSRTVDVGVPAAPFSIQLNFHAAWFWTHDAF